MTNVSSQIILDLYHKGERERIVFLKALNKSNYSIAGKILDNTCKRYGLKVGMFPNYMKNKVKQIVELYKAGYTRWEDYMDKVQGLKIEHFRRICELFDLKINIPTPDDIALEKKKESWCRFLFNEKNQKEYTMEDLDRMFYIHFKGTTLCEDDDQYGVMDWLRTFHKYYGLNNMSENKLRLIFQRQYDLFDCNTDKYRKLINAFHRYLPIFIKRYNIKNFKLNRKPRTGRLPIKSIEKESIFDSGEDL